MARSLTIDLTSDSDDDVGGYAAGQLELARQWNARKHRRSEATPLESFKTASRRDNQKLRSIVPAIKPQAPDLSVRNDSATKKSLDRQSPKHLAHSWKQPIPSESKNTNNPTSHKFVAYDSENRLAVAPSVRQVPPRSFEPTTTASKPISAPPLATKPALPITGEKRCRDGSAKPPSTTSIQKQNSTPLAHSTAGLQSLSLGNTSLTNSTSSQAVMTPRLSSTYYPPSTAVETQGFLQRLAANYTNSNHLRDLTVSNNPSLRVSPPHNALSNVNSASVSSIDQEPRGLLAKLSQHTHNGYYNGKFVPGLTVSATDSSWTSPPRNTLPNLTDSSKSQGSHVDNLVAAMRRSRSQDPRSSGYTTEEDNLLVYLKESCALSWKDIFGFFKHRASWNQLQSRYSSRLKTRPSLPKDNYSDSTPDEVDYAEVEDHIQKGIEETVGAAGRYPSRPHRKKPMYDVRQVYKNLHSIDDEENYVHGRSSHIESSHGHLRATMTVNGSGPVTKVGSSIHYSFSEEDSSQECMRDIAALSSMTFKILQTPTFENPPSCPSRRKRHSISVPRPYLNSDERLTLQMSVSRDVWNPEMLLARRKVILHVDFIYEEVESLEQSILAVLGRPTISLKNDLRQRLATLLQSCDLPTMQLISKHLIESGIFLNRSRLSIDSFLNDLKNDKTNKALSALTIKPSASYKSPRSPSKALRARELGSPETARLNVRSSMTRSMQDSLGPRIRFSGTSSDVNSIAWGPRGDMFAVCAFALTDTSSMQYNRPNNLLIGDITLDTLRELPYHAIKRTASSGINASHAMQRSQDPLLFTTISAVQFSPNGNHLFSAGYDRTVRIWDVYDGVNQARLRGTIHHSGEVDLLAIHPTRRLLASGSRTLEDSIQVFDYAEDDVKDAICQFSPQQAISRSESHLPSCMRWGSTLNDSKYLLAGFSSTQDIERKGTWCLWDVEMQEEIGGTSASTRSVFDVAWSSSISGRFAIGCVAGHNVNKGTKSVVRIMDSRHLSKAVNTSRAARIVVELECPAFDMNDVIFNPRDNNMISVGCTDGSAYVWDLRRPDRVLHQVQHGNALHELDSDLAREEADTGVRFISWDSRGRNLFTGSSDGIVAQWDPYLSNEDVHIRDIVHMESGIMSAAFSPDESNLLLGTVDGTILALSVGYEEQKINECSTFKLQDDVEGRKRAYRSLCSADSDIDIEPVEENESAVDLTTELLRTKRMEVRPLGNFPIRQAVQGTNYDGPFDRSSDAVDLRKAARVFQDRFKLAESMSEATKVDRSTLLTEEELGDNHEWRLRIPETLRRSVDCFTTVSSLDIACFGCDSRGLNRIQNEVDVFECTKCHGIWEIDLLGYKTLKQPVIDIIGASSHVQQKEMKKKHGRRYPQGPIFDHYHSLWED